MREKLIVWAIGLVFLLLSGTCYRFLAEVNSLSCDRESGQCTVRREKLSGTTERSFAVAQLRGARLGGGVASEGSSASAKPTTAKRIVILTATEEIDFMSFSTDLGRGEMEEQIAAIEKFVQSPEIRRLDIVRDNRKSSFAIAMIPFALAVAWLWRTTIVMLQEKRAAAARAGEGLRID